VPMNFFVRGVMGASCLFANEVHIEQRYRFASQKPQCAIKPSV
jgi:hypothetical protein